MAINHPKAGPNYVPAYQVSGIPYVTSSVASEVPCADTNNASLPVKVAFPYVTKFVTVRNTGINGLRVGFTPDGVIAPGERRATVDADKGLTGTRNYFLVPTGSSGAHGDVAGSIQTFEVRCKEIHFLSNAAKNASPAAAERCTSFTLLAGLTNIQSLQFPLLTGSNGFEGVG